MGDELVVTVISLVCDITCFGELGQGTRESFVLSLLSLYLHVTCLVLIGENRGLGDGAGPRVSPQLCLNSCPTASWGCMWGTGPALVSADHHQ